MEGEELAAQHVAQGGAHYEGGLEDGDVEGGRGLADTLLQESDAQGDQRSRPRPVQQLTQYEDVPVAGQGALHLLPLLLTVVPPPGARGLTEVSTQRAVVRPASLRVESVDRSGEVGHSVDQTTQA